MLLDQPPEGYAACCEAIAAMDLRPVLAAVRAPTLVVVGAHDPATPLPHGRLIADGVPGARLEVVAGAHLATVEDADRCTALLLDHLGGPDRPDHLGPPEARTPMGEGGPR
jgi:3-oxoadipate enol-lactonase